MTAVSVARSVVRAAGSGSGTIAAPAQLGPEMISNGSFASDTVWTKGNGWTIGSGVATHVPPVAGAVRQALTILTGIRYRVVFDITAVTASTIRPRFIGGTPVEGTERGTVATHSEDLVGAAGNTDVSFSGQAAFDGSIDNCSMKRRFW